MDAWIWLIAGLCLMMIELLVPSGFFLLILGLAGIAVGTLIALGVVNGWVLEVIFFCAIAVALWIVFGKRLAICFRRGAAQEHQGQVIGAVVKIAAEISPGGSGSGTLWGTTWRLVNVDTVSLPTDSEAIVVASEGIGLHVKRK